MNGAPRHAKYNLYGILAMTFGGRLARCADAVDEAASPLAADDRFLGTGTAIGTGAPSRQPTAFDSASRRGQPVGYAEIGIADQPTRPAATGGRQSAALTADGQRFDINFVDTDVQEFVRIVFEEILRATVVVDPAVTGRVTVRTAGPVSKAAAIDLVRSVLALNGATLSEADGVFRVAAGRGGGSNGGAGPDGERPIAVIPLHHIDAEQARGALQAFGAESARIASLPGGRVLVVAAPAADIGRYEQVIATLDVDQMKGRSFALVPLQEAGAAAVATELNAMFPAGGDAFRALPIERMNAVLIIGRSSSTILRARDWVMRLDQAGADERRVHVYPVRNRRAGELADILKGMIGGQAGNASAQGSLVAPGLTPAVATTGATGGGGGGFVSEAAAAPAGEEATDGGPPMAAAAPAASAIAISADPTTNSIVVVATPEDYALVERAIRRLDVMPTQVLIEATIAEVTLNDKLRHGVRWFFESGGHGFLLTDDSGTRVGPIIPGFNYVFSISHARVVIDALEEMTDVEIVSSPALTVLDNQTATLKVGDQVPVATRSAQSLDNPDAPVVNEIEMKDTGVILSVRPRVNADGLVQLDISQEISDVVPTTTSSIDSPTIRQRAVTSSVVVQSGTEIVLGGMISTRRGRTDAGVPLLKDIPLLGFAFTSHAANENGRTELLIIIRPVVLTTSRDVQGITSEIKSRMTGIGP